MALESPDAEPAAKTMASAPLNCAANSGPLEASRSSSTVSAPRLTRSAIGFGLRITATTLSPAFTKCSTISSPVRPCAPMTTMRDMPILRVGAVQQWAGEEASLGYVVAAELARRVREHGPRCATGLRQERALVACLQAVGLELADRTVPE